MTSSKNVLPGDGASAHAQVNNWQDILWREFRYCDDKEHALHLFSSALLEPVDRWLVFALLSSLIGGLGGWLLGLLITGSTNINGLIWILSGMIVGGLSGVLIILAFSQTRLPTWHYWLLGFIPSPLRVGGRRVGVNMFDTWKDAVYFRFALVSGSIIGVSITGILFFDQANSQFYFAAAVLLVVIATGIVRRLKYWPGLLINGGLGILFGLFFGLGFAQLVGLFITPLDLGNSARVVGLAVGVSAGLFFGRRAALWLTLAGLLGLIAGQIVFGIIAETSSLSLVTLGWLVGFLAGGVVSSISRVFIPNDLIVFDPVYNYRATFIWWWKRPFADEVETALKAIPQKIKDVQTALDQLEQAQQKPDTPETYIAHLPDDDWVKRFVARQMIVFLGGEAITSLQTIANDKSNPLHKQAIWLMQSIGHDTRTRLGQQASELVCPTCITRFGLHTVRVSRRSVDYYGCRTCGQSRAFEHFPQGIVAILDAKQSELQAQNGILRVNWLERRELFDFDRVEIIRATDEDVERFAVQVGNDTDTVRDGRYTKIPCSVAPDCRLSPNTLRILQKTFAGGGDNRP